MIETIKASNSIEELVERIKAQENRKTESFKNHFLSYFERFQKRIHGFSLWISVFLYIFIPGVLLYLPGIYADESTLPAAADLYIVSVVLYVACSVRVFYKMLERLGKSSSPLSENYVMPRIKSGITWIMTGLTPVLALTSYFLYNPSNITALVIGMMVTGVLFLGLYKSKKERIKNDEEANLGARNIEIISEWLEKQKQEIIDRQIAERKQSIRDLHDYFTGKRHKFKIYAKDEFLGLEHKETIETRIELMNSNIDKLDRCIAELNQKEKVIIQTIQELINRIVPKFKKQRNFLSDLQDVDRKLEFATEEIKKTRKQMREIDEKFIKNFLIVSSALERASIISNSLIEITGNDLRIESIDPIYEEINSFTVDELNEITLPMWNQVQSNH